MPVILCRRYEDLTKALRLFLRGVRMALEEGPRARGSSLAGADEFCYSFCKQSTISADFGNYWSYCNEHEHPANAV